MCEGGWGGFEHQGLVDNSFTETISKTRGFVGSDRDEAVAGQSIGCLEAGRKGAVIVGDKGRHPGGGGVEVRA